MRVVGAIIKQEILKVVKNKKMLFSIFVLPLLLLVFVFGMTYMQMGEETIDEYKVYFLNTKMEETYLEYGEAKLHLIPKQEENYEAMSTKQALETSDIVVDMKSDAISIYYSSVNNVAEDLLSNIENGLLKPYIKSAYMVENNIPIQNFELKLEDTSSQLAKDNRTMSFMLPYLIMIILFMSLVSVVGDSIAGERERGTLNKQMLAPIDNVQLIMGKLLGSTIIGVVSSIIYFVALVGGSILMEKWTKQDILGFGGSSINMNQIMVMLGGFIFIALVFVAAIVLMSSFAKSIKEATNMSLIVYFLIIIAALTSALNVGEATTVAYMIPIYNFSLFMQNVLVGVAEVGNGIITLISLIGTFGLLIVATLLNFRREQIIC